jgi:hypothetical protein
MHPGGWAHDTRPDRSAGTNYANNLGTVDGVDGVQPNLATARLISAGGRRCRVTGMEHVSVGAGVGVVCPSSAAGRGGRVALASSVSCCGEGVVVMSATPPGELVSAFKRRRRASRPSGGAWR